MAATKFIFGFDYFKIKVTFADSFLLLIFDIQNQLIDIC